MNEYKCQVCGKLIKETDGITNIDGSWTCDNDSCRWVHPESHESVPIYRCGTVKKKLEKNIGYRIASDHLLLQLTEHCLSMIFDVINSDDSSMQEMCEDMGVSQHELDWAFKQLGYDKYEGLEVEELEQA